MLDHCLIPRHLGSCRARFATGSASTQRRDAVRPVRRALLSRCQAAPNWRSKRGDISARVGTVTFGLTPSLGLKSGTKTSELPSRKFQMTAAFNDYEYSVGALNGEAARGSVTFRGNVQYFRFEKQWHIIPSRYSDLPQGEMHRRMKIKIRNRGKAAWNLGKRWDPEIIQRIRTKTISAMQRSEVQGRYYKKMALRVAAAQAAAQKRELKKRAAGPKRRRRRSPEVKRAEGPSDTRRASRGKVGDDKKEEWKRRISEALKRKWRDPEYRRSVLAKRSGTTSLAPDHAQSTDKECREKYDALMETIMKLTEEINALEAQKALVAFDADAVREIDEALERSRQLIEHVREAVHEVEERLGIHPSPLDTIALSGASQEIEGNGVEVSPSANGTSD